MTSRAAGRLAVLASGTGSNAMAVADAVEDGRIAAPLACVLVDRTDAPVIARARARGIDVVLADRAAHASAEDHERAVVTELLNRNVAWVVLAGYMRICGPRFLRAYEGRALNVHPSLLPAFPGRNAIGDALEAGVAATGVTVHFIDAGVDTGPIVSQEAVAIRPGDDHASLAARIHDVEHRLLPDATARLVAGHLVHPYLHLDQELLPT